MNQQNQWAPLRPEEAEAALNRGIEQVRINLPLYAEACQNHSSVNGIYPACGNVQWTCGFWPGEIWLSYEHTGDPIFLRAAEKKVDSFWNRIVQKTEVDHHDMGFLYSPSCVSAWKLTGNQKARQAAILAADQLLTRFQEKGQFFQAWGAMGEAGNYRYIIDCLMNLPLLYWAARETGNPVYAQKALAHTATCFANSFRQDGSSFHTFFMRPDGTPDHGETCQGYRSDSAWARGQAWGIYGSAISFRCTGKPVCLRVFRSALDFYLSRLPQDLVPYWDLIFGDGSGEPRDSSSAAIAACGLLEAEPLLPKDEAEQCRTLAGQMLRTLAEAYVAWEPKPGAGILLHGTYSKKSPYNTCTQEGVDEYTSWGDYFYLEALTRYLGNWDPYW